LGIGGLRYKERGIDFRSGEGMMVGCKNRSPLRRIDLFWGLLFKGGERVFLNII